MRPPHTMRASTQQLLSSQAMPQAHILRCSMQPSMTASPGLLSTKATQDILHGMHKGTCYGESRARMHTPDECFRSSHEAPIWCWQRRGRPAKPPGPPGRRWSQSSPGPSRPWGVPGASSAAGGRSSLAKPAYPRCLDLLYAHCGQHGSP